MEIRTCGCSHSQEGPPGVKYGAHFGVLGRLCVLTRPFLVRLRPSGSPRMMCELDSIGT